MRLRVVVRLERSQCKGFGNAKCKYPLIYFSTKAARCAIQHLMYVLDPVWQEHPDPSRSWPRSHGGHPDDPWCKRFAFGSKESLSLQCACPHRAPLSSLGITSSCACITPGFRHGRVLLLSNQMAAPCTLAFALAHG